MCCTFQPAQLSKTIIYAGHTQRQGKRVAVLAYQNAASSRGANAMVLPFPSDVTMGPDNIVDTREGGYFLRDLDASARHQTRRLGLRGATYGDSLDDTLQIFESGSYTVVLTRNVLAIPAALTQVPEQKRPQVSEAFLIGYERRYAGWQVAICCWNGHLEAEPLLWWYEPRPENEQRIFIPTMDAHDGLGPKPGPVQVDHSLIWGHEDGLYSPHFRRPLPQSIRELMPRRMSGSRLNGYMDNGDTWASAGNLERVAIQ